MGAMLLIPVAGLSVTGISARIPAGGQISSYDAQTGPVKKRYQIGISGTGNA